MQERGYDSGWNNGLRQRREIQSLHSLQDVWDLPKQVHVWQPLLSKVYMAHLTGHCCSVHTAVHCKLPHWFLQHNSPAVVQFASTSQFVGHIPKPVLTSGHPPPIWYPTAVVVDTGGGVVAAASNNQCIEHQCIEQQCIEQQCIEQ